MGDDFVYWRYFYLGLFKGEVPKFAQYWPPGFPFAILGLSYITGDFFLAGKLIVTESAIILLLISYILLKRIFSEQVAFFSVLLLATNRHLLFYYVFSINSQVPFTALILFSIYFLIKEFNQRNLIASSIFLGLATLIRVTGFFYFPAIIFKISIHTYSSYQENQLKLSFKIKKLVTTFLKYFGIFLLVLSPYLIFNTILFTNPIRNDNIDNLYDAIFYFYNFDFYQLFGVESPYSPKSHLDITNPNLFDLFFDPETSPKFYESVLLKFLLAYPKILFFHLFYFKFPAPISGLFEFTFQTLPFSFIFGGVFLIIIFFGYLFNYFLKEKPKKQCYLISTSFFIQIILITFLLFSSMGFLDLRFLIPIFSLIYGSFIFVLTLIINKVKHLIKKIILWKNRKNYAKKLHMKNQNFNSFAVLILSLFIIMQFSTTTASLPYSRYQQEMVEYKIAGDFLKDKVDGDDIIFMHKHNYLYYIGDCIYEIIPSGDTETVFTKILEINGEYLIYSKRIEGKAYPHLKFLLNPTNETIPESFILVFEYYEESPYPQYSDREIVIYEIKN